MWFGSPIGGGEGSPAGVIRRSWDDSQTGEVTTTLAPGDVRIAWRELGHPPAVERLRRALRIDQCAFINFGGGRLRIHNLPPDQAAPDDVAVCNLA